MVKQWESLSSLGKMALSLGVPNVLIILAALWFAKVAWPDYIQLQRKQAEEQRSQATEQARSFKEQGQMFAEAVQELHKAQLDQEREGRSRYEDLLKEDLLTRQQLSQALIDLKHEIRK